ncbi:hypothetical protein [Culicoidibacter larvae]|uniref:Uncharacterized protein n=1 Tax=Culicoidibacter larvae TaxID=2579976 RepID=A0A5R8Q8Y2_9FIRM|nr:hypothetical protein [Culicoidibacter larvae]TLG72085.1 hypothetical protein FEZ08_09640 [Culicoidibacter larvae]
MLTVEVIETALRALRTNLMGLLKNKSLFVSMHSEKAYREEKQRLEVAILTFKKEIEALQFDDNSNAGLVKGMKS